MRKHLFYGCKDSEDTITNISYHEHFYKNSKDISEIILHIGKHIRLIFPGFDKCVFGTRTLTIEVDENNPYFKTINGILYSKDGKTLIRCPNGIKNITIPDTVETIGPEAFSGLTFDDLVLPDSVQTIGNKAFEGTYFNKLTLPKSLKEIGSEAFKHCHSKCEITIPDSVKSIGYEETFRECHCPKVTLPGVEEIPTDCFENSNIPEIILSEGTKIIRPNAFSHCKITEINIPSTVEEICIQAFRCTRLKKLTLPETLKIIGKNAFTDTGLHDMNIFVEKMAASAFKNCTNIHVSPNTIILDDNKYFIRADDGSLILVEEG